ncbi:dihydrodipicolinate synthase [[Eubacterium] yurii subsp. margaretiae ATCC 43715]|nr:dihydrodipicolinate synthase [[Eubacterium] yurii subsp. margaretiae ATCC 43715]
MRYCGEDDMKTNLRNCMTAMITPFKDGEIDYSSLDKLIEKNVQNDIDILVCGTTAETATLEEEEYTALIRYVVEKVDKRVNVIAGCGTNSTKKTIKNAKFCEEAGADGLLIVTPYYNKTTQEGLYQHYKEIAKNTSLPIILYNVPSRTGLNMASDIVIRLSKIDNIVGIKEASGNIVKSQMIVANTKEDFMLFSGNDDITIPMMSIGAKGIISVISNAYPKYIKEMVDSFDRGEVEKAGKMQVNMVELSNILFVETNPIPIKKACNYIGLCENELRLPLVPMTEQNSKKLIEIMKDFQKNI